MKTPPRTDDTVGRETPVFHTVSQVAARWHCSERKVRRTIKKGELIAHKFDGVVRVAHPDLVAYERMRRMA